MPVCNILYYLNTLLEISHLKLEKDVPVLTPSRQVILDTINSEIKSLPESRGLAFAVTCRSPSSLPSNIMRKSNLLIATTFRRLKFAVFETVIFTQKVFDDVIFVATSDLVCYPKSSDYSIVVAVAGETGYTVDTLRTKTCENINISGDIIEPFLPPSAPALADIPKIFLLNTIRVPKGYPPHDTSSLIVPSEGNFLVYYSNSSLIVENLDETLENLSNSLCHELTVSRHSIEDALTEVKGQLSLKSSMTVISHLDKPVYLHPDGPMDPIHTGEYRIL